MDRFTLEDRWEILRYYFQSKGSATEAERLLKIIFGEHEAPSAADISTFVKEVRETGMLVDIKSYPNAGPVRIDEKFAAVAQNILHKELGILSYKVQFTEALKQNDHTLRYYFSVWALNELETDLDFGQKIIFSDEAHFHLGGYVKKHNCRIWGSENPYGAVKSIQPQKVIVWCGFWSGGIIGPYFFEDEAGNSVMLNRIRYKDMLTEFLWPQLDELDLDELWFQQDGTTSHTSNQTIDLLRTKFGNRVISRCGDVNWPARSCDLMPLDFFLWGNVKDSCYSNDPQTIDALKENIHRAIREIESETIEKVLQNWVDRVGYCHASHGSHVDDIIFHT